jgi:hypothetical protein
MSNHTKLTEAIEAVSNLSAPPGTLDAAALELTLSRLKSHKNEIEAVSITLRMRGIAESDFHSVASGLTPGEVAPVMLTLERADGSSRKL